MVDFSRRSLLIGAGAFGVTAPLALSSARGLGWPDGKGPLPSDLANPPICGVADPAASAASGPLKKVLFAWNAGAPCLVGITVAKEKGFFEKNGLDVELVNYAGSTDQLLETLATGKADAAAGMALRWLKPLEQGFDVKIVASLHGGCLRLLAPASSGIKDLSELKGKSIAISDQNSPAKNFFAIRLKKAGVDPATDVDFKQFPGPLLRAAVEKGEAHVLADSDPNTYLWLKDGAFTEVSSNLTGEYAHRVCCIVGIRGSLLRNDPATASAIARALVQASHYVAENPEDSAATYLPWTAGKVGKDDLTTLVKYHTHAHHPAGHDLKAELSLYAEELKLVSVMKPSLDVEKYANRIYAEVLS